MKSPIYDKDSRSIHISTNISFGKFWSLWGATISKDALYSDQHNVESTQLICNAHYNHLELTSKYKADTCLALPIDI
jgi:hypothetical protein